MGDCFICLEPCRKRFCTTCKCYAHPKCANDYLEENCPVCKTARVTIKYRTRQRVKKLQLLNPITTTLRDARKGMPVTYELYTNTVESFLGIDTNMLYKNKSIIKQMIWFIEAPEYSLVPCEKTLAILLLSNCYGNCLKNKFGLAP